MSVVEVVAFDLLKFKKSFWNGLTDISEIFPKNVSESNKFKLLEDRIRKILKDSKNRLTLSDRLSLLYNLMSIAKLAKIPSDFHSYLNEVINSMQINIRAVELYDHILTLKSKITIFDNFAHQKMKSSILFEVMSEHDFIEVMENKNYDHNPSDETGILAKGFEDILRTSINSSVEEYKRSSANLDEVLNLLHLIKDTIAMAFYFGISLFSPPSIEELIPIHIKLIQILNAFDVSIKGLDGKLDDMKTLSRSLSGGGNSSSIVYPVIVPNLLTSNQKPTIMANRFELYLILGVYKVYCDKLAVMKSIWCTSFKTCYDFISSFAHYLDPDKINRDHINVYESVFNKQSKCGYFDQLIGDSTSKVFTLHLPYGSTIPLLLHDYEKFSLSSLINNICGIRPEYKSNEITFKFNDNQKLVDDKECSGPISLLAKNNQLSAIVCIGNLPNIVKTEKSSGEFPMPLKKFNSLLSNISSLPIVNESSSSNSSNATSPTNSPKREGSAKITTRQRNSSTPTQSLSPERERSRKISRSTKERNKNKESSDKSDRNEKSEGRHENENENNENIPKEIVTNTNEEHNNRNVIEDTENQNEDTDNNAENSSPSYTTTHYISNINNNNEEEVMGLIIRRPSQQRKILRNLERSQHGRKGSSASVGQDVPSGDASPLNQSSSDFSISSISSGNLFVDNTTTPTTTTNTSIIKNNSNNNSNSNSLHRPQQLRSSIGSSENISQDKSQSTPVAFSELFAQLDSGIMKKFEVDHEKETQSVTEDESETGFDSEFLSKLDSLPPIPLIPLVPHEERLEKLKSKRDVKKIVNVMRDEISPRRQARDTPRGNTLMIQFNSTKEKNLFSNFLENVKSNYGLTSDADALLVLESTIDWLSMDKSNSLVLGKKIFCSDFGETTFAHLHAFKTPIEFNSKSTIADIFPKTDLKKVFLKSDKANEFLDRKGNILSESTLVSDVPGRVIFLAGDKKTELDPMSINIEVSQNSEPPSPRIIHSNQASTPSPTLLPLSPAFQPVKDNVLTTSQNTDLIPPDRKKQSQKSLSTKSTTISTKHSMKTALASLYPEDAELTNELLSRSVASLKNPKISGYLLAWRVSEWKKLWVVLEGEHVYVFLDENSKKAKSVYFLRRHAIGTAPESSKKNSFKLTDPNIAKDLNPVVFSGYSAKEAEEWIDTIKDTILTFSNVKAKYLSVECLRTECTVSLKIIEVKFYGPEEKRDTFCTIYGNSTALARTSTVFLSERPLFLEEFEFDGEKFNAFSVIIYEQRHANKKDKPSLYKAIIQVDDFLMAIDSHELELKIEDIWYKIYSTPYSQELRVVNQNTEQAVGEIRLAFERTIATILPDKEYNTMFMLLMDDDLELVKRLASVSNKLEKQVAEALVKAFDVRRASVFLVITLLKNEIVNTQREQILFRQNTVATKALDTYLRLTGMHYLHHCLKSIVAQIQANSQNPDSKNFRSCELDSHRMEEKDEKKKKKMIEKNYATLIYYCDLIMDSIKNSFRYCPTSFRNIFTQIQSFVIGQENFAENCRYTAVSGLIWLRFFCIALLTPKTYGLIEEQPSATLLRELTLIGKTLQNLANMMEFGKKEEFMIIVNPWINKRKQDMKDYIDKLCSLPTEPVDEVPVKQDPLTFGREMGKVHTQLKEALPRLTTKYGTTDKCMAQLITILDYYDIGEKNLESRL